MTRSALAARGIQLLWPLRTAPGGRLLKRLGDAAGVADHLARRQHALAMPHSTALIALNGSPSQQLLGPARRWALLRSCEHRLEANSGTQAEADEWHRPAAHRRAT